ncbi:zinc-binding dehydrogenase [Streptomyces sp. RTd22]|uniref:zinc-binding dehydrogenase n=1 Tax=Streptomyces sp. RTd22 TaxID=1841249 RepID=UPI0007C55CDE|nr:zinc-binding dehydrogenase [Streptomyces sp. RTd22]
MWAYVLAAPRRFEKVDVPAPEAGDLRDGQVLLRTLAGGICGSDAPDFRGLRTPLVARDRPDEGPGAPGLPGFPMHEVVGEVVASRDPSLKPGARVVGWADSADAIAAYVVTAGAGLAECDPALEPTVAALLQPLACVLSAVDRLGALDGADVAVLGQGPIGILFSHVIKERGARRVTGVDVVDRDDVAGLFGVDEAVRGASGRWAAHLADDRRPGVVVEAIGHQTATLGDAIDAVAPSGLIHYFGIPEEHPYALDMWKFLRKQLTMQAGTTLERRRYLQAAGQYLAAHRVLADHYVTHTYGVGDVQAAYECADVPAEGRLKVAVSMA